MSETVLRILQLPADHLAEQTADNVSRRLQNNRAAVVCQCRDRSFLFRFSKPILALPNGRTGNCPGCATHQSTLYNRLINQTQNTAAGGNYWGPSYDMFDYMSDEYDTSIGMQPGDYLESDAEATISCSASSLLILDTGFLSIFFRYAQTLAAWTGDPGTNCGGAPEVCEYKTVYNCTAATSPPIWQPLAVFDTPPPLAGWWTSALCVRGSSQDPWHCGGIPGTALKTTQTTPGVCTAD
jgi:hypothetical protein